MAEEGGRTMVTGRTSWAVLVVVAVCAIALALGMGCSKTKETPQTNETNVAATGEESQQVGAGQQAATPDTTGKVDPHSVVAVITMAKGGDIVFTFYPDDAPKTVESFIMLANKGFYNGLKFHRVVPGFVVQGGDPKGDGTGDAGFNLPAEFNKQKHITGTVAMARAQDPNSGSCQFYICLAPQPTLDGKYTVFGQVTKGMDIVKGIKIGDVMKTVKIAPKSQYQ
jgi:peptidyl-prolyl cis-trans isomerase B (cyclophilin B)